QFRGLAGKRCSAWAPRADSPALRGTWARRPWPDKLPTGKPERKLNDERRDAFGCAVGSSGRVELHSEIHSCAHAGASGSLVQKNAQVQAYVREPRPLPFLASVFSFSRGRRACSERR